MSTSGAPQQHKQPSRKGKKAWRKNVDVTELQDGLEVYNEEVRTGGPLKDRKSEDLFAVDVTGSKEVNKKYNLGKVLKVDEILAQRSAVPAIDARKRPGQEVASGIYEPASKRRKGDWVSKKDVQQLKRTINATSHLEDQAEGDVNPSSFDLWGPGNDAIKEDTLDFIPKPRTKVAPKTITQAPIAVTANGKPVKAVRPPQAGTSYNPDFDEWNELIVKAGDKELAAEQSRIKAAEEEAEKQARIAAMADADDGTRTDDESAWEGFETENDDNDQLKKKRPTRKTPVERNKAKRRKEAERQAKHERRMADKRKLAMDLIKLADTDGEVAHTALDALNAEQDESGDETVLRRRRMGPVAIPEKNLEVVLPEELQDSLRLLKPEGNLLQDRFRNLLVNGKIENRKPVLQPRRRKVKLTEKWSFKDFSIPA